jgi:hypothetical protein
MYSDEYHFNQERIFPRCTQVQNRGHDIYRQGRHEGRRKRGCCNKGTATDTKRSQEGEKALNFGIVHTLDADGEQVLCYNTYNLFVRLPEQEGTNEAARQNDRKFLLCGKDKNRPAP